MTKTNLIKVVVVEDHPMFRERLVQLVSREADMQVCGEADNAEDALALVQSTSPDLVLVDLTLRGSSGLTFIKVLRALGLNVSILVVSMHDESLYAQRAIRAGAGGYITKLRGSSEVLLAMRKVLAGEIYVSSKTPPTRAPSAAETPAAPGRHTWKRLTDREIDVLRLIGQGRTTREIAENLGLGIASIDTYKARIKEKVNLRNAIELQHFAMRWLLETDQEI